RQRWIGNLPEPGVEACQPLQLGDVELAPDDPSVRHVDAHHADAGAGGRYEAAAVIGPAVFAREAGADLVETDPGGDADAVPCSEAVVSDFIAELTEGEQRNELVGQLGLLHAEDVRLLVRSPGQHAIEAGLEGVDVPGREPHRPKERTAVVT